ncbi:Transposase, IS4 [Richelia intracellularis]|nr:Transposase, IS4 [Richelia intracellularis]
MPLFFYSSTLHLTFIAKFFLLNHLKALNLEQSLKRSNRQKSNRATMDNNYMLTVLTACCSQDDETSHSASQ